MGLVYSTHIYHKSQPYGKGDFFQGLNGNRYGLESETLMNNIPSPDSEA